MDNKKIEYIAGGAAVATVAGAALAAYLYKTTNRTYKRIFDKETIEEIKGQIEEVVYSGRENGEDRGVVALINLNEEIIPVHLGPAWFIDHQEIKLKSGDNIHVKGSRMYYDSESVLIAETVVKDNMVMRLRNSEGQPMWSAWSKI